MTIRTSFLHWMGCLALAALVASPVLAQDDQEKDDAHEHAKESMELPEHGVAVVIPTQGNKARGLLRLMQQGDDLQIKGQIRNLSPGEHGFHIHEFGDLRGTDGTSAGGHFDPNGHEHGAPGEKSHMGDLGNITADRDGVAKIDIVAKDTPLHIILGRSFVVHAGKDDLSSQPAGDSGPRVGVGVIGVANPEFKAPRRQSNN